MNFFVIAKFYVPVYGLINMQECKKFKLSNDGTDEDDAHFISHVDGSLYVKSFEEPFSNEEYCVEFVNMGTIDVSKSINQLIN